jgi:hypothetical protein
MSGTHIFLDNSNIFGGAQTTARAKEKAPWPCVRIEYEQLFRLLLQGKRDRKTSMLAGSVPPGNEALWTAARAAGFDTTLLHRVDNDTGRLVEQGVDEAIHLRIANILLDAVAPGTIILATGDGRPTEQGSSFPQQVRRAARRDWNVEIWSWDSNLSPILRNTQAEFPGKVKVFRLDAWYASIVFLKGGTYYLNDKSETVITRRCTPLNLTEGAFADAMKPAPAR